jgi:hypothetical protein
MAEIVIGVSPSGEQITDRKLGAQITKSLHLHGVTVADRRFGGLVEAICRKLGLPPNSVDWVRCEAETVSLTVLDGGLPLEQIR